MTLKKIYNGHFRRIPAGDKAESTFTTEKSTGEAFSESKSFEKKDYGIVDNIIYGAGMGVGAVGLSLAVISSTVIASTLLFSSYFCANTCNVNEEEEELSEQLM
ncbi:conserved Plasmodium protein, unknown function [Plasmodium vivax]|uniref:Uncharacterized protein n=5 Tax=Plasmodium vivax TaxID=5855 RepID=A0A0J9TDU3_PLAVI|nr:hypothetical protein PVIIG_02637 [Plasmodium vivax India VII]KMZ87275.1 hypothetical protein PVBG_05266 [Plasmodium vivax Brazil I]KMZ93655.1 hypothetical protein PVMG_05239 [Plasmodium vivax Mauritania I]KNA00255.1 hypothetical protein PVNG_04305 [Plasmodium vivax North Korean]CAG9480758.1 unnamed protein product [Plasmodium vivax]